MKKPSLSLYDLRNLTGGLLSLAFKQRFPKALLQGIQVSSTGFFCDFVLKESFGQESLAQVEEVMQAWIRQKLPVEPRVMVSRSAKEYFLFHGETFLAQKVENSEDSEFFLLEIAGKMVLCPAEVQFKDLGPIAAFALQKIEQVDGRLRIYGTAFYEKSDLKEFLRVAGKWNFSSHEALGKSMRFFQERKGQWIWLPKGQKFKRFLQRKIEELEESYGFQRVSTLPISEEEAYSEYFPWHFDVFLERKERLPVRLSEIATFCISEGKDSSSGLLDGPFFEGVRSHVFCQKKDLLDELISSLHFMTKIFKILDFAFHPVLLESRKPKLRETSTLLSKALDAIGVEFAKEVTRDLPKIEARVVDPLGRSWQIACIEALDPVQEKECEEKKCAGFSFSPCLSFERLVAVLLEKEEGVLPFWLVPLQVKVVALQEKHRPLADQTLKYFLDEGIRAEFHRGNEDLKAILQSALNEGVPYVAVLGDKEIESKTVTLRDVRAKQARSLPRQELIEMLKKELKREYSSEL